MRMDHIGHIKGNISIRTNVKTANILDGAYKSIFKGKSLNFEELREYNLGDSVKDIDWRASARSMNILVREYVAEKKHNIMFIMDSKYAMNANSNKDDLKRDVLIDTVGTIAYLAYKNGDYVGAIYMKDDSPVFFPFKQNLYNIENFLTFYEEDMKNQKIKGKIKNNLNDSLLYITDYISKRSVTFILTDISGLESLDEEKLKTLSYRNDVMIIVIEDVNLFENKSYDLDKRKYFSKMFLKNKKLARIENEEKNKVFEKYSNIFTKYKVTTTSIKTRDEVIPKIIELLERQKDANTR